MPKPSPSSSSFVLPLACSSFTCFLLLLLTSTATTNVAHAGEYWDYSPVLAYDLAFYARAASCPKQNLPHWTCGPACNPHSYYGDQVPHASNLTRISVMTDDHYHVQAISGYDYTRGRIIVAFADLGFAQGESIHKLLPLLVPYTLCETAVLCLVMKDFYWPYNSKLAKDARQAVSVLTQAYKGAPIYVTGAAVGGTFAVFFALDFQGWHDQSPLKVMTFAQPRIGTYPFVKYAQSIIGKKNYARITKQHDEYVRYPPRLLGYDHLPHEIHYPSNSRHYVSCDDALYHEDSHCAMGGLKENSVAHKEYLGVPLYCDTDVLDPNV